MTTSLITFCDESMARSACVCVDSARQHGVDAAHVYTQLQLQTTDFYRENEALLSQPRGCGFWAWKPFILLELMKGLKDGDIAVYADAGIKFVDNVNFIVDRMDQDIWLFGNMYEHAHWCKRDIIDEVCPAQYALDNWLRLYAWTGGSAIAAIALNPETERVPWSLHWDNFGKQAQASVIFFRVSGYTRKFVREWLGWCLFERGRLVDDSPSGTPNHPEFQENRHDQAILTTMAYRDGIPLHWWPATYNDRAFDYPRGEYPDEGYPVLFHHHRKRNHEWEQVA